MTDEDVLRSLNVEMGAAESRGDRAYFDDLLAPAFAMRRADGVHLADRAGFLAAVAPSGRRDTTIDVVEVISNRAIVRCTVVMDAPGGRTVFDNLRVFTRPSATDRWTLLAWANEPVAS